MPATNQVITAADTSIAVFLGLPATHDLVGFSALTYVDIGEIVDGGSAGKTFNKVDHSPLGTSEVLRLKGSYTQGDRSLVLGRDTRDAGQSLIVTKGVRMRTAVSFRITYQNLDVEYFTATIDSYTDDIGTIDSVVQSSVTLAVCNEVVRAYQTGVNVIAVTLGGTFVALDGTYFATQASVAPTGGNGILFEVDIASATITAVRSIINGYTFAAADVITLAVEDVTETVAATITVTSVL